MLPLLEVATAFLWSTKKEPPPPPPPPDTLVPTLIAVGIFWVLPLVVIFLKGSKTVVAECKLEPGGKPCGGGAAPAAPVSGTVKLVQTEGKHTVITYHITGLSPGKHGFHIHEKADFTDGCNSAGPHYNPFGKQHGGPSGTNRHVGDLGNVEADANGVAKGKLVDELVQLEGMYSVIGRSIMVHEDEDDLGMGDNSQPNPPLNGKCSKVTGNAGKRLACGAIVQLEPKPKCLPCCKA